MAHNLFQQLYYKDLDKAYSNFKGIIFDNLIDQITDLQTYFGNIYSTIPVNSEILISYHNPLWEPLFLIASKLKLRQNKANQNWIDSEDLKNILLLCGFNGVKTKSRFFGMTFITTAAKNKKIKPATKSYSASIIIPARNEAGNITKIIPNMPRFGKYQEFIFVEGNSTDNTWQVINQLKTKYPNKNIKILKQKGKGKADATWLGRKEATGDILMIYDADRTVPETDLPKFYNALAQNYGQFANGNRLLYPMEKDAMQTLNKLGNQFFSTVFTWLLGQRFKDTLCGTKVFWKRDFKKFNRSKTDPFGDFDLIFGAIRNNLKVVEIPVRYKERVYGKTNINRFYHGLLLFKMAFLALMEFKLFPK